MDMEIHKCGLCGILTRLLRRVMCARAHRSSNESCYRELDDQDVRLDQGSTSTDSTPSQESGKTFQEELNDMFQDGTLHDMTGLNKGRPVGMFYSFRKKNRKIPLSSEVEPEEIVLDNCYPMQVQLLLSKCSQWEFDTHALDRATGGRCLPTLCMHLFQGYGLIDFFKLLPESCMKLFHTIEENYHATNPYHNSVHAADVTQAIHCFLQQPRLNQCINRLEVLVVLLAAITHDIDHPGVNHSFLVATNHPLAIMFKDKNLGMYDRPRLPYRETRKRKIQKMLLGFAATKTEFSDWESSPAKPGCSGQRNKKKKAKACESILEHHHWRAAYSCILESGIFDHMQERLPEIQRMLKSLILATDITRQNDYLNVFKDHLKHNTLDMTRADHRHMVLQMALKTADISNPGRPWSISKKWSYSVCDEFYNQGDQEEKLNIKISNLCNRNKDTMPKIQTGFFRYVVTPLYTEWHHYLMSDLSKDMLKNLVHNEQEWTREDHRSVTISDADMVENNLLTSLNVSASSDMLIPTSTGSVNAGVPRRASYSPFKPSAIRDTIRRYSAPLHTLCDQRRRKHSFSEIRLREDFSGFFTRPRSATFVRPASAPRARSTSATSGRPASAPSARPASAPSARPTSATSAHTASAASARTASAASAPEGDKSHYLSMLEIAMVVATDRSSNDKAPPSPPEVAASEQLIDLSTPRHNLRGYTVHLDSDDEDDDEESSNGKIGPRIVSVITEESSISSASQLTSHGTGSNGHQFLFPSLSACTASAPSSESRLDTQLKEDTPAAKAIASSCELIFTAKAVDEITDVLFPHFVISEVCGTVAGGRRRGSAPAPVAASDLQRLASSLSLQLGRRKQSASCHQWVAAEEDPAGANGLVRRGSLPVEAMTGISA